MNDTICAISTTLGVGAISIVRVVGNDAINIVNKITDINLKSKKTHTINYAHIKYKNEIIDEVLIMLMKAPKTYTTLDTVEINCHGGINTTNKILEILLDMGCRLAEPGEFTKLAYLNGRINLLEAESVNDLIVASTDAARTLAINNVDGLLTKKIKNIREKLVKILANIEVNIDYPEYTDEVIVTNNLMKEYLVDINKELTKIVNDSKNGRLIKEGINIAIIGRPNVGKSSILNHLLDEEKAIVTSIPGTTRDIVEGSITLNGIAINFIDTAGIRKSDDIVEQIGVKKSKTAANNADLILLVLNNNELLTKEDKELIKKYDNKNLLILINKNDLEDKLVLPSDIKSKVIYGNTIDLNGLDSLKNTIIDYFSINKIVTKDMSYLSNVRQIDLINKANKSIKNVTNSLKDDMPIDLVEIDLKEAWEYLGQIIGDIYDDELVDQIFANFCLGK